MISAERIALVRALQRHPDIKAHVGDRWRVKRLEPSELRQLAKRLGIDMEPIRARAADARERADPFAARVGTSAGSSLPLPGAFRGAVEFSLTVNLLGHRVERRARVRWGYTPGWDHHSGNARLGIVRGKREQIVQVFEIEAQPDREALRLGRDGVFRPRPLKPYGVTIPLLEDGVLSAEIDEHLDRIIEEDARAQDMERRGGFGRPRANPREDTGG